MDQMTGVGCFECDTCTHSLLDVTDSLFTKLYYVSNEFKVWEESNKTFGVNNLMLRFF